MRRNPHFEEEAQISSNEPYCIHMGFRKFVIEPIFSRVIGGSEKTKYCKTIKENYSDYFLCSFYYYNCYPPSPALVYRVNKLNHANVEPQPIMVGEVHKMDPLHIILERIILTGYPHKINRRRSTIRYMFFNPKDVKYFRPVELRTKLGLKVHIDQFRGASRSLWERTDS